MPSNKKRVLMFPLAGGKLETFGDLILWLKTKGFEVDFLTGYFGTHHDSPAQIHDYHIKLSEKMENGKVYLMAESVGAIHAMHLAAKYPNTVEKVVLFNPAFIKPNLRQVYNR